MRLTLAQIAALCGGRILQGDPELTLEGFAGLREAKRGDLSFFGSERYLPDLKRTAASAILVPDALPESLRVEGPALVAVPNPSEAFGEIVRRFLPPPREFRPGIHPAAIIDPTARLNREKVCIRAGAVIEAGAEIGDGTEIGAGCVIGENARIGRDCLLHPRVTVYHGCVLGNRVVVHAGAVIGADGFGYQTVDGRHRKIEQAGIAVIEDDVEIGANTTIDRARFGRTVIGEGSKLDNLVMIGHNCVLGKHVIVVAQAGIAGSTRIGDRCIIAAQAGVSGHLEIGPDIVITAQAGVTKNLTTPGHYTGYAARPSREAREQMILARRLPELFARLKALEAHLGVGKTAGKEKNG